MKKIFLVITLINLMSFSFAQKYTKVAYKEMIEDNNILMENNVLYFNKKQSLFIPNYKKKSTRVERVGGSIVYPSNTIDSLANKPRFVYYDGKKNVFYNNLINNDVEYVLKKTAEQDVEWQDTDEYKTILGHQCRKSVGVSMIGGREYKYIAWYSLKDKRKFGPFQFFHPKGLVLELEYEAARIHLVAEKIENITECPFGLLKKYDFSKALTQEQYNEMSKQDKEKFEKKLSESYGEEIKSQSECKNCN